MMPHDPQCRDRMAGGYPCTCDVESWRFRILTEPDGPGSMTVVVTFAGDETITYRNVLVPVKGEPFSFSMANGVVRVRFESNDHDPVFYEAINPLSITTLSE